MKLDKTKAEALFEILLSLNRGDSEYAGLHVSSAFDQIHELEKSGVKFKEEQSDSESRRHEC